MGEEEKKKEEEYEETVVKVDMHCEGCARKIARSLKGFQGVQEVTTNCKESKVVVKGKQVDPVKVSQRIQKKTGRKAEIVSPLPKPLEAESEPKPEKVQEVEPLNKEKKAEATPVITVVLKMSMHCEACAQGLQRRIRKIPGVESVKTELGKDEVVVTGVVEPDKLVSDVYKRTRKAASIVVQHNKAEEGKKEVEETKSGEEESKKTEIWGSGYYMEQLYSPQFFSDENPNACSLM